MREATLLPDRIRQQLASEAKLGAGNILQYAMAVSLDPKKALLTSHRAFQTMEGKRWQTLSLEDLRLITQQLANWYWEQGIKPKDPVVVFLSDGIEYLFHFIALTSLGAIPALVNGLMAPECVIDYTRKIDAVAVMTDTQRLTNLLAQGIETLDLSALIAVDAIDYSPPKESLPPWYPYQHDANDPVMITHSSGTTGAPKAVCLQHHGFFYGPRHLLTLPVMAGFDRILCALPTSHNSAIAYALYAIICHIPLMITSDYSGQGVLDAIESFQPSSVIAFPKTYVEIANCDLESRRLGSIHNWINSGDAAHEKPIRRLVKFGHHYRGEQRIQGSQFIDGLGSSEMGHTLFRIIHTPYTNSYGRCIGLPQSWVEAAVLDAEGNHLPDHHPGYLGIKAPSITSGYWNNSTLTHRSRLAGYWLTGDVVLRKASGEFYHLDRVADVIQTASGACYSTYTEELLMSEIDEINDCSVFAVNEGTSDHPYAVILLNKTRSISERNLLNTCNQVLAKANIPRLIGCRIVVSQDIPVGITGKVLKRKLRDQYHNETVFRKKE